MIASDRTAGTVANGLGFVLLAVLGLPVVALAVASTPGQVWEGIRSPAFAPAFWLSLKTSLVSLAVVAGTGTPLAWWLARAPAGRARAIGLWIDLPIVLPPAVLGVALLEAFGRKGLLGPLLDRFGISLPFTTGAVIVSQIVVSAPFYVQAATAALRRVDPDLIIVARTLGAPPFAAFVRVVLPLATPGLVAGAAMAWARSIGEFGATLLFAGNRVGVTQTMPLAVYTALETDVRVALALALTMAAFSVLLLGILRWSQGSWSGPGSRGP